MKITETAIARPVATAMLFISLVITGLIASRLLPLELFPEIDVPFVMVEMPYPGSTPEEVERLITRPAEESIATIPGISRLNSESRPDGSGIFMMMDWGENVAIKAVEVREKIEAVRGEMPDDLRRVNVFKFNTSDEPVFTLRISSEKDLSEAYEMLYRNLVLPLQRLPGVARVELEGVEPKEVRIELNVNRVSALGIDLAELDQRLVDSNFSASAGLISDQGTRYRVNPEGEFRSVDEIRNLVINDRGTKLSDVAEVTFDPKERTYERHLDQQYAIGLEIFKERGANLVEVGRLALEEIERIGKTPQMQGIELFFLGNAAEGVTSSLRELLRAGLIGALLSIIVLYLFLRNIAATLTVTLAVPISITITLGVMYFLGLSLNILSMMGLMLAVGLLVDNAVVVSESIFHERETDPGHPRTAAIKGTRSVGLAVVAGTVTSSAVFLPNIFGDQNQISIFLSHVAVAICVSLLASLVISLTVIPLVASRIRIPANSEGGRFFTSVRRRYGRVLRWLLGHRWWTVLLIVSIFGSVAIPISMVKVDMFPEEQRRELFLRYNLNAIYSLERLRDDVDKIEDYLYANQERFEIRSVYTFFDETGTAQSTILLTDDSEAKLASTEIKKMILEGLPKIATGQPNFDTWRTGAAEQMSVTLIGESSERLREMATDIVPLLRRVEGLRDVRPESGAGDVQVNVRVDRERAARYGLNAQQVAEYVSIALRGRELSEFRSAEGEIPITLKFREADSANIEQLLTLRITTPDGRDVPVGAVADISRSRGPVTVRRQDRQTALGINAELDEITVEQAQERIKKLMDGLTLPAGYTWRLGRGFDESQEVQVKMLINIGLAILLIFLVMAALFESLLYPLAIVTTIAFSFVGVFWFFLITGTALSLLALIGLLILIGVVVNNGIVYVDRMNQLRHGGMPRIDAIVQAGQDRLRPILMTVATTVLGMVPLCLGNTQLGGEGPAYFPMARAIVGGLLFSTVVSLLLLPGIYLMLDDLRLWARDRKAAAQALGARVAGGAKFKVRGRGAPET